jgi:hypothetical protein
VLIHRTLADREVNRQGNSNLAISLSPKCVLS